jgi:hypothetical protein
MSRLQLKMFAVSRAEFKGDDDADARCTAVGVTFPPFFAGSVPSVIQLIVMSIRIVAVVMAEAASSCTQPTATDATTTAVVTSMQRPRCR